MGIRIEGRVRRIRRTVGKGGREGRVPRAMRSETPVFERAKSWKRAGELARMSLRLRTWQDC